MASPFGHLRVWQTDALPPSRLSGAGYFRARRRIAQLLPGRLRRERRQTGPCAHGKEPVQSTPGHLRLIQLDPDTWHCGLQGAAGENADWLRCR